jgi:hypothetical protein
MMSNKILYICPSCFTVCETPVEEHSHRVIECYVGESNDIRRKPITDKYGRLVSRAPRWYLEACQRIPAWTPVDPRLLGSQH